MRERVVKALAAHRWNSVSHYPEGGWACRCGVEHGWEESVRPLDHVADALLPVIHAERDKARAEAWDEGFNAGFEVGGQAAKREPTTRHSNPYQEPLGGGDES